MSFIQSCERFKDNAIFQAEALIQKFQSIPNEGQYKIIGKTVAIAAAAGILGALALGPVAFTVTAVVAGVAAFSYFTKNYTAYEGVKDFARGAAKSVDQRFDQASRIVEGYVVGNSKRK